MEFIDAGSVSPEESVELDKKAFDKGNELLMIYSRDSPCVSLGRFSRSDCYDEAFAMSHGMSVVRRISGGSAIYSDDGQITITMIARKDRFRDKNESYGFFGRCLANALNKLGINAEYKPVNDVLLNGKKISGSAQYRNNNTVLIHGSLILRLDRENLGVLRPVKEIKHPVGSIEEECGCVPERKELFDRLSKEFANGF